MKHVNKLRDIKVYLHAVEAPVYFNYKRKTVVSIGVWVKVRKPQTPLKKFVVPRNSSVQNYLLVITNFV